MFIIGWRLAISQQRKPIPRLNRNWVASDLASRRGEQESNPRARGVEGEGESERNDIEGEENPDGRLGAREITIWGVSVRRR